MKPAFITCLLFFIVSYATAQNLIPFRNAKGLWGYKDAAGKIIVQPKYEFEAHEFSNGVAIVRNSGLKGYGVIDSKGNEIVPPQYNVAFDFVNGLSKVCVGGKDVFGTGGKWGFIDTKGKVIIPIKYEKIEGNFEGDSYVKLMEKDDWSMESKAMEITIDKSGKEIRFTTCDQFYGTFYKTNLSIAIKDKMYGFVDKTGKVIIPFEYERVFPFSNGLAAVLKDKDGKWGYIDEKNKWVLKPQFSSGSNFYNGFAIINKDYKLYGCMDKTGKMTIPFEYSSIYPQTKVTTPLVVVKKNKKIGLMNPVTGSVIAPIKYDEMQDFTEGLASVKLDNKYGYVNSNGEEVIPLVYDFTYAFSEGLATVKSGDKYGFIDKKGKVAVPIIYKYANEFKGGVAVVTTIDNRQYMIDKNGNEVK